MNRDDRTAIEVSWAVAFVAASAIWLGLTGLACERGDAQSTANQEESSAGSGGEARGDGSSGSDDSADEIVLPGETEPGTRKPKSPGPEGPGIFFLAGLKGYLEPCGCTADVLLGGAERIAGYLDAARRKYDGSLMLDAGDTFFETTEIGEHERPQQKAKSKVVAALIDELGSRVTVPGERDFAMGVDLYQSRLEASGMEAIGANVELDGEELPSTRQLEAGDWTIGVVGAADPKLYEDIDGVEVNLLAPAVDEGVEQVREADVDAVILLLHGGLARGKRLLESNDAIDFVVVGHDPRETDQVDGVGDGWTLEAYDQGRYVGVLKLFGRDNSRPFANARTGSEAELEKLEKQIEHVNRSLDKLPPESAEDAPPIRDRLRERLDRLQQRREAIKNSDLELPESRKSFLFRPVGMKPGYPVDDEIAKRRVDYNSRLKKLSKQANRSVEPPKDGEPEFVGTNQCATCHADAHEFWEGTRHADAFETLEKRDKAYDPNCIGCHVVGYEKPGGSVVGKWRYEAEVDGEKLTKELRDVGCETCHGPGSKHRAAPVDSSGKPQYIDRAPGRESCMQCHVQEHSPRFEFEKYVDTITGEGHERSN